MSKPTYQRAEWRKELRALDREIRVLETAKSATAAAFDREIRAVGRLREKARRLTERLAMAKLKRVGRESAQRKAAVAKLRARKAVLEGRLHA